MMEFSSIDPHLPYDWVDHIETYLSRHQGIESEHKYVVKSQVSRMVGGRNDRYEAFIESAGVYGTMPVRIQLFRIELTSIIFCRVMVGLQGSNILLYFSIEAATGTGKPVGLCGPFIGEMLRR